MHVDAKGKAIALLYLSAVVLIGNVVLLNNFIDAYKLILMLMSFII